MGREPPASFLSRLRAHPDQLQQGFLEPCSLTNPPQRKVKRDGGEGPAEQASGLRASGDYFRGLEGSTRAWRADYSG